LKQLGLALHNFHDTYGLLPAPKAYYFPNVPRASQIPGNAWGSPFFHLLPFLEQDNLYKSSYAVDPRNNVRRYYAPQLDNTGLKVFTCPTDYLNTGLRTGRALGSYAI